MFLVKGFTKDEMKEDYITIGMICLAIFVMGYSLIMEVSLLIDSLWISILIGLFFLTFIVGFIIIGSQSMVEVNNAKM